jgi:hypothetical protein
MHGMQRIKSSSRCDGDIKHVFLSCGCTLEIELKLDFNIDDIVRYEEILYRVDDFTDDGDVILANKLGHKLAQPDQVEYIGGDTLTGTSSRVAVVRPLIPKCAVWHNRLALEGKVEHFIDGWTVRCRSQGKQFNWDCRELTVIAWPADDEVPPQKKSKYFGGNTKSNVVASAAKKIKDKRNSAHNWDRTFDDWRNDKYGSHTSSYSPTKKKVKPRPSDSISTADLIKDDVARLHKEDRKTTIEPLRSTESESLSSNVVKKKKKLEMPEPVDQPIPKRRGDW